MPVAEDLPGLPGVPAAIGPVQCPDCEARMAEVRHQPAGDGQYTATLVCQGCGACFELGMTAYTAGLTAGVWVERARTPDARWQALKDYAAELKESASRYAGDSGYPAPVAIGMEAQAEVLGAVLAKMDELEAEK